mgnify:CR=1 FL=1
MRSLTFQLVWHFLPSYVTCLVKLICLSRLLKQLIRRMKSSTFGYVNAIFDSSEDMGQSSAGRYTFKSFLHSKASFKI